MLANAAPAHHKYSNPLPRQGCLRGRGGTLQGVLPYEGGGSRGGGCPYKVGVGARGGGSGAARAGAALRRGAWEAEGVAAGCSRKRLCTTPQK